MAAVRATPTLVEHTTNRDEQMTALDKRFDLVCEGQRGLGVLVSEAGVR
jgi:hypothetical protein